MADHTTGQTGKLFSGRLLARNVVINLVGQSTPILVAVFAIPLLIKGLGIDRFGVLTLAWMVIGYFSLFDLGLGRALTKLVAERLGNRQEQDVPALVWTAVFIMLFLGLAGTLVVGVISPWLVHHALKIPEALQAETLRAFYLLACSIPVVTSTAGLRGVLEAHQRFGMVNAIRIPMGVFTFLGPLTVLPFSHSLFPVTMVLVAGRIVGWLAHGLLCLRVIPSLRHRVVLHRGMVKPLISFGSWMTVSNVVGPLMVYLDRFVIGVLVSVAAVAYYATPYELITKLLIIPWALCGVLFPAFAGSFIEDGNRTARLFERGVKYTFLIMFPLILIIVTLAHEGLNLWLGAQFVENSTRVLQWLAIGVFVNSLAQVPSALIQGVGRPDLTAKLHLAELPFYLLLLWWLLVAQGITGAAVAWAARAAVDTVVLFAITRRLLPGTAPSIQRSARIVIVALLVFTLGGFVIGQTMCGWFLFLTLGVFVLLAWFLILEPEERTMIRRRLKTVPMFN